MALKWAVATGNWSNLATWDGGTLPLADDDVFSNNFTVTIDQDISVLSISNKAAPSITTGGTFKCSTSRTISANLVAGASTLLTLTGNTTVTINGAITGGSGGVGLRVDTGTANLTLNGVITGGSSGSAHGVHLTTNSVVNITGDIYGGSGASARGLTCSTNNPTISITGDIYGGAGGGIVYIPSGAKTLNITGSLYAESSFALSLGSSKIVNISGVVQGGSLSGRYGIDVVGDSNTINIDGAVSTSGVGAAISMVSVTSNIIKAANVTSTSGSTSAAIVANNNNNTVIVKALHLRTDKTFPIQGSIFKLDFTDVTETYVLQADGEVSNVIGTVPSIDDVKTGVFLLGGEGTVVIPDVADVREGVAFDTPYLEKVGTLVAGGGGGSGITTDDWDLYFSGFPKMRPISVPEPTGTGEPITLNMLAAYYAQFPCSNPRPMSSFATPLA